MSEDPSRAGGEGAGIRREGAGIRASDADREQLISELNEHVVAGRLDTDEFEQRLQAVNAARTTGQLDALRADLPATQRGLDRARADRRSHLTRRLIQETGGSMSVFVVCSAIWLFSDSHRGQFWPVWVLIVVVLSLVRNAWALYGPAPDLETVERRLDHRRERQLERDTRRARRRL